MEPKRRQLLTEPGEDLLLSQSAADVAFRYSEWIRATGLRESTASPLCVVPLPVYNEVFEGKRRFSAVPPELMWHPLFWLPERLHRRYEIPSLDGGPSEIESDDLWSVRVAMELKASGMYSPEDGWIDIMSSVGLDVENEVDLARIEEWQAGYPDELLDSIDLDLYLKQENDELWALEWALALLPTLKKAQWAFLSDSLIEVLDEAAAPDSAADLPKMREVTYIVASMAASMLYDVPVEEGGRDGFWDAVEAEARTGSYTELDTFISGPVTAASDWLYATRDRFWASIGELNELNEPQPA